MENLTEQLASLSSNRFYLRQPIFYAARFEPIFQKDIDKNFLYFVLQKIQF